MTKFQWFYFIFEHWYLRCPAALLMGFLIQNFYIPGNTKNPWDGIVMIVLMCAGTSVAYYLRWR